MRTPARAFTMDIGVAREFCDKHLTVNYYAIPRFSRKIKKWFKK